MRLEGCRSAARWLVGSLVAVVLLEACGSRSHIAAGKPGSSDAQMVAVALLQSAPHAAQAARTAVFVVSGTVQSQGPGGVSMTVPTNSHGHDRLRRVRGLGDR